MTDSKRASSAPTRQNTTTAVPRQPSLNSLEDLLARAEHCATMSMQEQGNVRAMFLIIAGDGSILLLPAKVDGTQEKDESVQTARLFCMAHNASALVVAAEAWMSVGGRGKVRGAPSEDPNRKEVVLLLAEARGKHKHRLLSILRTESGAFNGFAAFSDEFGGLEGRFANILPSQPPTPEMQTHAKQLLAAMGVQSISMRLDGNCDK